MIDHNMNIAAIKEAMIHNAATKAKRRAAKPRSRLDDFRVDVDEWQRQFDELVAQGIYDINIGYWRVSTDLQVDGLSPEIQEQAILSYGVAAMMSRDKVDLMVWDIDSGLDETREGIQFIRRCVETGLIESVVCYKLDRFSRDPDFASQCLKEFKAKRTKVVSINEQLDDSLLGDLIRRIMFAIAEYEARLIVMRTSAGKKRAIENHGVYNGGMAPYGYESVGRRGATGKGVLVINEPEAAVVRLVFALYQRGYNGDAIAHWLNEQGIPMRCGTPTWMGSHVRRIIDAEPQYRAERSFSRWAEPLTVAHPPIMDFRPDVSDRSYVKDTVELYAKGVDVPEDPFTMEPIPPKPHRNSLSCLTREQASAILLIFKLVDSGLSQREVALYLREAGVPSLRTADWNQQSISKIIVNRVDLQRRIDEMGVATICIQRKPVGVTDEQRKRKMEAEAQRIIFEMRGKGVTVRAITEELRRRNLRTLQGGQWHPSTVDRVLKGTKRRAVRSVRGRSLLEGQEALEGSDRGA